MSQPVIRSLTSFAGWYFIAEKLSYYKENSTAGITYDKGESLN